MLFIEGRFILFLAVVLAVHWMIPANRPRKVWLLLASYGFYAAWDWRFLSLILISTLVDYVAVLRLARTTSPPARRGWLTLSLVTNLGLLGIFKYLGFFAESLVDLLALLGLHPTLPTVQIILPVGISFYTFQTLSYTIDVYRRRLEPATSLLDVALFVAFFPQLVAGPIVRARDFLPQLGALRRAADVAVRAHLGLFLAGYVKKACVSDNLAPFVDAYFADPGSFTGGTGLLAVALYSVQIYCDFSGYSDMAIASAGLLGYHIPDNFRAPYLAGSIREFWQRWHISLSTWLRDYLYIPLGGNRGTAALTLRNLMLTMVLGGLWHGAAWTFVIWGALHGLALIVHRGWSRSRLAAGPSGTVAGFLGVPLTYLWVCLGWVFFRAVDLHQALDILRWAVLGGSPGSGSLGTGPVIAVLALAGWHFAAHRWHMMRWWQLGPDWTFALAYAVAVRLALLFAAADYQPFIYFQF